MKTIFIITVAALLVMAACVSKPSCLKPYILVDGACCEDRNENGQCDSKELAKVEKEVIKEVEKIVENKTEEVVKPTDEEAAAEIKESLNLTLPSFAYAIRTLELPVVERHALSEGQVASMIRGLTKSKLETLHYANGYLTNWTNSTSVLQAVLVFKSGDDADVAFDQVRDKYLLEERFDKDEYRQIYDNSAKMSSGKTTAVVIRRANVVSLLLMVDADVDMAVGEAEASLVTKTKPSLLADVEPVRTSYSGTGPYHFSTENYAESNSIVLGLSDLVFTKKGTDWGEISSYKLIVDNRGTSAVQPKITLLVLDRDEKNPSSDDVVLPELAPGDYAWQAFNSTMSVANLGNVKSVRVTLVDGLAKKESVLVSVTKDYTFS